MNLGGVAKDSQKRICCYKEFDDQGFRAVKQLVAE